jgi:uncharacterized protein
MPYSLEQHMSRDAIVRFCKTNHIRRIAVFGSAIRNELGPESDIDILVEFEEGHVPGFFGLSRMQNELSDAIGREVDLRTPDELSKYFRDDVVREAETQYEEA